MFFINPFIYGGAGGDFESIATVTVGSGGATSVTFSNIPGTYQHLQVRQIARADFATTGSDTIATRLNGDTGNNYAWHNLYGTGSAAAAGNSVSPSFGMTGIFSFDSNTANVFGAGVIDILDYANTSKNTTIRYLSGVDYNGSGVVVVGSALWMNTSAVTSLTFLASSSSSFGFKQHSTFALYGVKAP